MKKLGVGGAPVPLNHRTIAPNILTWYLKMTGITPKDEICNKNWYKYHTFQDISNLEQNLGKNRQKT